MLPDPDSSCLVCGAPPSPVIAENALSVAFWDGYAVSPGHTLIVPRRHLADWFEATPEEQRATLALLRECQEGLAQEFAPDGFNIGVNCGLAAGQTVMHLHRHLIPRYTGDVDDPAGGVRFVIPEKGDYKQPGRIPECQPRDRRLGTGGQEDYLWRQIQPHFSQAREIDNQGITEHIQPAGHRKCSHKRTRQ